MRSAQCLFVALLLSACSPMLLGQNVTDASGAVISGVPCPRQCPAPEQPGTHCVSRLAEDAGAQGRKQNQAQATVPMTEKEVAVEIKSAAAERVIEEVKARGVDFDMTPGLEKKLRKAKATDEVLEAVRQAGPKVRANMANPALGAGAGGAQQIPPEETRGFYAIQIESDPDKTIALVDDFAKKYPNSSLLSYSYALGASAYQQKGDVEKVAEYTGKSLKLKPDNLMSLFLRAAVLPLPQYLNNHPADRGKLVQEAESDAHRALQLIQHIPKQPNEADRDYQKRLAGIASGVYGALGTVHLARASEALTGPDKTDLAKAEQELKIAVSTTDRPSPQDYFRLGEACAMDGKLDDAIQSFKYAGQLGQGTLIETYADRQIALLIKRKAQGSTVASNM